MKKISIFYFIIPIAFGIIAYLSSDNLIIAISIIFVSLLYFFLLFMNRYFKYKETLKRFKSCYNFINSFIISLSIKLTVPPALESVAANMDNDFKQEYEGLEHITDLEKLDYLKKYYNFHVYDLFLNVVKLFEERGGNILDMSSHLLNETRKQSDYLINCELMNRRKWIEFGILWFLSLAIMVLLRFALSQFFSLISQQIFYKITIAGVFVFVLFSIEILSKKSFSLNTKGWDNKNE